MIVTCEPLFPGHKRVCCGRRYDDEFRWTICPHPELGDPEAKELMDEYQSNLEGEPVFEDRHPSTRAMLKTFRFKHLPPHLQAISEPFHDLAVTMVKTLPDDPELTAGLRKLREAKDCMVVAAVNMAEDKAESPS